MEYAAFGKDVARKRELTTERLGVLRAALANEEVGTPGFTIQPRAAGFTDRIWQGVFSEPGARFAAAEGSNLLLNRATYGYDEVQARPTGLPNSPTAAWCSRRHRPAVVHSLNRRCTVGTVPPERRWQQPPRTATGQHEHNLCNTAILHRRGPATSRSNRDPTVHYRPQLIRHQCRDKTSTTMATVDPCPTFGPKPGMVGSVVVEAFEDVGELYILQQPGKHMGHIVNAGVADNQTVRAPEITAAQGFSARGPTGHEALDRR
jgi:hypothetical protein